MKRRHLYLLLFTVPAALLSSSPQASGPPTCSGLADGGTAVRTIELTN